MGDYDYYLVDKYALKYFTVHSSLLIFHYCRVSFVVFTIEASIFRSAVQSVFMLACSSEVIMAVSFNNSSQYSVSAHSFRAIVVLYRNSFFVIAYWASVRFAPIDVPERNNCFDRIYSRLASSKCLQSLYMRMANCLLFFSTMLSDFIYSPLYILYLVLFFYKGVENENY